MNYAAVAVVTMLVSIVYEFTVMSWVMPHKNIKKMNVPADIEPIAEEAALPDRTLSQVVIRCS
jgi:hypothetical protein